jgi:pantothenate kinase
MLSMTVFLAPLMFIGAFVAKIAGILGFIPSMLEGLGSVCLQAQHYSEATNSGVSKDPQEFGLLVYQWHPSPKESVPVPSTHSASTCGVIQAQHIVLAVKSSSS